MFDPDKDCFTDEIKTGTVRSLDGQANIINIRLQKKDVSGFCIFDVLFEPEPGSPKFQLHKVMGPPPFVWERSEN